MQPSTAPRCTHVTWRVIAGLTPPLRRCRLADLSLQLPARNPLLLQMARGYIEHHYGSAQPLLSDKVRIMVRQRLAMGGPTCLSWPRPGSASHAILHVRSQDDGLGMPQ